MVYEGRLRPVILFQPVGEMHTELQSFVIVFVCTGSKKSFKFLLVTRNSCWVARVASILEKYEAIYILFCLGKWVIGQWTYMVWRSLLCKVVSNKKFMTLAIGIFHLGLELRVVLQISPELFLPPNPQVFKSICHFYNTWSWCNTAL